MTICFAYNNSRDLTDEEISDMLENDMDKENQDVSFEQEQSEMFQDKFDMYRNEY